MDGEAEPTMRLHLHVSHAVQGELFPSADAQPVTRGYRGTVASKVAGITYRQLDYWARKQIVEPSITPSHGSGSRRFSGGERYPTRHCWMPESICRT